MAVYFRQRLVTADFRCKFGGGTFAGLARKRYHLSDLHKILQFGRYPRHMTYADFGDDG